MEMPGWFKEKGIKQIATMLELNSHHIDQIRNYFLATSDEEKLSLQNNIGPMFLKGFLTDLKSLFILEPDNESKLISIAKSMGASKHIESLKEIQQQFYSQLAETYLSGNTNSDIDKLLEVNNQNFLNEVNYQKELSSAFILNEREKLKNTFYSVEKESQITDEEIVLAFKQIERERIKNLFKKIEDKERVRAEGEYMVSLDKSIKSESNVKFDKRRLRWPEVSSTKSNWKQFAIAASVIGLIVTTTFIIFNQRKEQNNVALNKPKTNKTNMDTSTLQKNQTANISTTTSPFPSDEKKIRILKEPSFGFAEKDEYLNVEINYLGSYLKDFKDSAKNETDATRRDSVNKIIDSVNNILNKYSLHRNLLQIYILDKQEVKVFKINDEFYFQIDKTVYECKKSDDLLPLKKVTDKHTLETIDKILFNESN
jgi:hypothetical protein